MEENKKNPDEFDEDEYYFRRLRMFDQRIEDRQRNGLLPDDYFSSGDYDFEKIVEEEEIMNRINEIKRENEKNKKR